MEAGCIGREVEPFVDQTVERDVVLSVRDVAKKGGLERGIEVSLLHVSFYLFDGFSKRKTVVAVTFSMKLPLRMFGCVKAQFK
jgi:hypothetical protein